MMPPCACRGSCWRYAADYDARCCHFAISFYLMIRIFLFRRFLLFLMFAAATPCFFLLFF